MHLLYPDKDRSSFERLADAVTSSEQALAGVMIAVRGMMQEQGIPEDKIEDRIRTLAVLGTQTLVTAVVFATGIDFDDVVNRDRLGDMLRAMVKNPPSPKSVPPPIENPAPQPVVHRQFPQMVYLVSCTNGEYKIGRSAQPKNRVATLTSTMRNAGLTHCCELIHSFPAKYPDRAERSLHHQFKDKRTNGEWFLLSPADVEWIKAIKEM